MEDQGCVQLYFSNSVDELAKVLTENLKSNMADDPFEFQSIFIPNAPLQKWLQLQIAESSGALLNLDFSFLEHGLWDLLSELYRDTSTLKLDQNRLQWSILNFFKSSSLENLPLLSRYFLEGGQVSAHKMWQLSGELSRLFLEYERNRPEMIKAWREGRLSFEDEEALILEQEQKELYCSLFQNDQDQALKTLVQFAAKLNWFKPRTNYNMPVIHVFGPSQLSIFHKRLLCKLGAYCKIHVYSLNVCSEYWEDLTSPGEDKWLQRKLKLPDVFVDVDGEGLFEVDENPLLKSWGKPGRETLKVFSDLEEECLANSVNYQSFWLPVAEDPQNYLQTVQYDILNRQSPESWSPTNDKSLQISACPSRIREVETVFNSIVKNLSSNSDLKLTDIAVLVTDIDKYKASISKVFDGSLANGQKVITYSLIDTKAENVSHFANGLKILFAIIRGEFNRKYLLELFKNPCFQARTGTDIKSAETFLTWCESVNMFREEGAKAFSFTNGFERMRLGRAFGNDVNYSKHTASFVEDKELLALYGFYLDLLKEKSESLQKNRGKAVFWQSELLDLLESFLAIPDEFPAELTIRTRLYEEIQGLVEFSSTHEELYFSIDDIHEFINGSLKGIPVSRGMYLGSGITIASLQPMRPVPFKHIYLLGLGENEFPGHVDKSTFDLRNYMRKIGDISLPEKNMYLFLETLVCAKEKLFLSYVSQDSKEDKLYKPSRVIEDLISYSQLGNNSADRLLAVDLPLKNYALESFTHNWISEGWKSLNPSDAELAQLLLDSHESPGPSDELEVVSDLNIVSTKDLAFFLRNPLRSFMKNNCGIPSLFTDDSSLSEDEPFSTEKWQRGNLLEDTIEKYTFSVFMDKCELTLEETLKELYLQRQRDSSLPQGVFGEIDLAACSKELQKLTEKLSLEDYLKQAAEEYGNWGDYVIGERTWLADRPIHYVEGVLLDAELNCRLSGIVENAIWSDDSILQKAFSFKVQQPVVDHILIDFLNWCLLYISGKCETINYNIFNVNRMKPLSYKFALANTGFSCVEELEEWFLELVKTFKLGEVVFLPISQFKNLSSEEVVNLQNLLEKNQSLSEQVIKVPEKLLQHNGNVEKLLKLLQPIMNVFEGKVK